MRQTMIRAAAAGAVVTRGGVGDARRARRECRGAGPRGRRRARRGRASKPAPARDI